MKRLILKKKSACTVKYNLSSWTETWSSLINVVIKILKTVGDRTTLSFESVQIFAGDLYESVFYSLVNGL